MKWWVYKCNRKRRVREDLWGDWATMFDWHAASDRWGNINHIPDLEQLRVGHRVIAYQTDQREIVGVVEVTKIGGNGDVHFAPLHQFRGAKVTEISVVKRIPAFQQGPIRTLYWISPRDARALLTRCAIGLAVDDVDELFRKKSLWRDIGNLRKPNPAWQCGRAARWWARRLGLPAEAVKILLPSGRVAKRTTPLRSVARSWKTKLA